jgi:hypothetical protein
MQLWGSLHWNTKHREGNGKGREKEQALIRYILSTMPIFYIIMLINRKIIDCVLSTHRILPFYVKLSQVAISSDVRHDLIEQFKVTYLLLHLHKLTLSTE